MCLLHEPARTKENIRHAIGNERHSAFPPPGRKQQRKTTLQSARLDTSLPLA
jgi:hypothetical protein